MTEPSDAALEANRRWKRKRKQGLWLAAILLTLLSALTCLLAMTAQAKSWKYAVGICAVAFVFTVGWGLNFKLHDKSKSVRRRLFTVAEAVEIGPARTWGSMLTLLGAFLIGLLAAPSVTAWIDSWTDKHSWLAAGFVSAVVGSGTAMTTWASDDKKHGNRPSHVRKARKRAVELRSLKREKAELERKYASLKNENEAAKNRESAAGKMVEQLCAANAALTKELTIAQADARATALRS